VGLRSATQARVLPPPYITLPVFLTPIPPVLRSCGYCWPLRALSPIPVVTTPLPPCMTPPPPCIVQLWLLLAIGCVLTLKVQWLLLVRQPDWQAPSTGWGYPGGSVV
jgi:hypothetical protein